jgi:hypothetical protein
VIKESRLGHGSSPEEECSTSDCSAFHGFGSAMHTSQGALCHALASFRGRWVECYRPRTKLGPRPPLALDRPLRKAYREEMLACKNGGKDKVQARKDKMNMRDIPKSVSGCR